MDSMARTLGNPTPPGPPAPSRGRDRAAAGFLIALMVIGSPILWIGVPLASSWVAGQLTADATAHLQITVPLTIAGMVLFAWLLFWVNKLYLRVAAPSELDPADEEGEVARRFAHGPLETILVCSLVVALGALTVWFFVYAENPGQLVF